VCKCFFHSCAEKANDIAHTYIQKEHRFDGHVIGEPQTASNRKDIWTELYQLENGQSPVFSMSSANVTLCYLLTTDCATATYQMTFKN